MFNLDPMGQWLLLAGVAYVAFMIGRSTAGPRESVEAREMRRMNEKQAAADAFAALSPDVRSDVDRLLMDKQVIQAIKVIREHTGMGLKDSKLAADQRRKEIAA